MKKSGSATFDKFVSDILDLYNFPVLIAVFSPALKSVKTINANTILTYAQPDQREKHLPQALWSESVSRQIEYIYKRFLREALKRYRNKRATRK